MVSTEALSRKQKFLELKKEHRDFEGITEHYKNLKWQIWHDENGNIISASKENNDQLDKKYSKAEFTNEQVEIAKVKEGIAGTMNWDCYKISTDKFDSSVKYLEVKAIEKTNNLYNLDLVLVDYNKTNQYNIKIVVIKNEMQITMHSNMINHYEKIKLENAVIKGRSTLPLYFTSVNDPSFLFYKTTVSLGELIKNKIVVKTIPDNLDECSIYTLNLFDTYVRGNNDNS